MNHTQLTSVMNQAEEVEIPVPWGHIRGKWWGPRVKQPILAIHGWQDNAGSFDKLIPMIMSGSPILAVDMPGHGLSSCFPKGHMYYVMWDGLIVVRRLVKYFGWTKKLSIIGHSMGGAVGFLYAASFPDEIEKLICLDIASPATMKTERVLKITGQEIDKFLRYETLQEKDMPSHHYEDMLTEMLAGHNGSLSRSSAEVMLRRGMRQHHDDKYIFTRDVRLKVRGLAYIPIEVALDYAGHIKCKVLHIRAKPGFVFSPQEYYHKVLQKIQEGAQKFEYHEVQGTHHLHLNTPYLIASYICNFLNS